MRNRARVQIGTFRRKNPRVAYIKQIYRNTEKPFSHFPLDISRVCFFIWCELSTFPLVGGYLFGHTWPFFFVSFSYWVADGVAFPPTSGFFSYGRFSSAENSNCFCGGFFMLLEKFLFQYGWRFSNFAI